MGKAEKRLKKWQNATPADEPKDTVFAVLKRNFATVNMKSGSHIVVSDDRLEGMPDVGPENDYSVPISGGQKVKRRYLRWISEAVEYMREQED